MRWMTHHRSDPERRLRPFYDTYLRQQLRKGGHEVHLIDDASGVAIWYGIDDWRMSKVDALRMFPGSLRTFGLSLRSLRVVNAIERVHPREPHFYLGILGVRQERQASGLGSALLADMLARCDDEGIPTYLEVSNPDNIPFYARHGFERGDEIHPGGGAPPLLAMWRDVRTA